jgi:hypothetical protein
MIGDTSICKAHLVKLVISLTSLLVLNLIIVSVKSSSSSCVPYASYTSSMIDTMQVALVSILLAREYWGSKYTPKTQKYNSTTLSRAKDSFVATSKSFHHLSYKFNKYFSCQIMSYIYKLN